MDYNTIVKNIHAEKARRRKNKTLIQTLLIVGITMLTLVSMYQLKMYSLRNVDKAAIIEEVLKTYNPDGSLKQTTF